MKRTLLILLSTISLASAAQSGAELFKKCGICHGEKGEKHSLNVTKYIAGLDEDNIIDILKEYRAKKRDKYGLGTMMQGQAAKLSDDDIETLAEFISKLPKVEIDESALKPKPISLDGKTIFKKCAVCHGIDAHKRSLNVSKYIAGMDKQRIIDTLRGYRDGKINQYGFGRMMKGQATKLTDEQMDAVAGYIQTLTLKNDKKSAKKVKPAKQITKEEIEYNRFMEEHFKNSTNPNETFEEAKKRWKEAKTKKDNPPATEPAKTKQDENKEEPKEDSSWF